MTWSISASGTKEEAVTALKGSSYDGSDKAQYDRAKAVIIAEVEASPASHVSVSASGHTDAEKSYLSVSLTSQPPTQ